MQDLELFTSSGNRGSVMVLFYDKVEQGSQFFDVEADRTVDV
jgi:hypothetical protein